MNIVDTVSELLNKAYSPSSLSVEDQSAAHAGHAGNRGGAHLIVSITSNLFSGKTLIERHRMIYQTLENLLQHDIHALSINAHEPGEK